MPTRLPLVRAQGLGEVSTVTKVLTAENRRGDRGEEWSREVSLDKAAEEVWGPRTVSPFGRNIPRYL